MFISVFVVLLGEDEAGNRFFVFGRFFFLNVLQGVLLNPELVVIGLKGSLVLLMPGMFFCVAISAVKL